MKLHWSPKSPFVRKVIMAALEAGLHDRLNLVRSPVAITEPNATLMLDNPLNKLPTLVLDDGTVLYDSLVICEYFDSLHDGAPLIPRAGMARWRALQRHALGTGFIDIMVLLRHERDRLPAQQAHPYIDGYTFKLNAVLDHLEADLPAYGEGRLDFEQITFGCALRYLDFRHEQLNWREGRPNLAAWGAWFESQPSAIASAP